MMNKKQREAVARGLRVVDIRPESEDQFRRPTLQGGFAVFSRVGASQPDEKQDRTLPSDITVIPLTPDPRRDVLTPDGRGSEATPNRQGLPPTPGQGVPPPPPKKQQKTDPSH